MECGSCTFGRKRKASACVTQTVYYRRLWRGYNSGSVFITFAAALLLYGGAGALNAPVQSIQAFERFAMPMSQIGFVLYNYVYSAVGGSGS
ncbi:MAG: hypothetical protein ACLR7D_14500 [Lachnospira eligens]